MNRLIRATMVAAVLFAGVVAEAKELKVSVFGDSYSTYEGEIPEGNEIWYFKPPKAKNGVDSPEKTWWKQVVNRLGATLLVNDAWSGATVSTTGYGGNDFTERSFVTRADRLGEDPDLILVCAGTNDNWANSPMGEFKWSRWTKEDIKAFRPALANMFAILKKKYPKAKVLYIINGILRDDVKESIRVAAKRYKAKTVELHDIEMDAGHPTAKGMEAFADQVMEALAKMNIKPAAAAKTKTATGKASAKTKTTAKRSPSTPGKTAASKVLTAEDSKTTIDEPRYIPVRWNSLGTSITWYNSHAGGAFQKGYQSRVMEQLKFDGFENTGISGGCVNSAIGVVRQADLYTVEHGVNDWGNRVNPGTIDDYRSDAGNGTFAANYRKVINNIRKANPEAKIVICTPRKAYGFGDYLPDHCDKQQTNGGYFLKDYADVVCAIAAYEKFPLADFYSTCGEQEELASLSIDVALHPNDAGYQRMANILAKTLLTVYPDATPLSELKPEFTDDGKPKDVEVKKFLNTTEQVVLKGTDISKVKLVAAKLGGGWVPGGPFDSKIYFEQRDPAKKTYTCQVQSCSPQDACMRIIALEFRQEYNGDVMARVLWNRYKFNCHDYGTDFSVEGSYSGGCASANDYGNQGYVIGDMTLSVNK